MVTPPHNPTRTGLRAGLRLLWRLGLFMVVNVLAGIAVLWAVDAAHAYRPWETDSLLEVMPHDSDVGCVILGTSHAYALSRFRENHRILEEALGMEVFNMGLPAAGGVRPARLFFEEFIARGNRAKNLLYLIEPFVFYAPEANDNHKFVHYEPVRPGFLLRLVRDGYPWRRVFAYVRSKFEAPWLLQQPETMIAHEGMVSTPIDPARVEARIATLYWEGQERAAFRRHAPELERIIARAAAAGMRVYLVAPPTLLGHEPGMAVLEDWITTLAGRYTFTWRDHTHAMGAPAYFYDLDHLNTRGVGYYAGQFLAPLLHDGEETP
jgi:hypothetical protein